MSRHISSVQAWRSSSAGSVGAAAASWRRNARTRNSNPSGILALAFCCRCRRRFRPRAVGLGLQPRLDRLIVAELSKSSELLRIRFGRLRQRRSGDQQSGERDDQKQPSAHVGATACH